jgi:ABC-type branched-subunit amino acid transport system permease subunit
LTLAGEVRYLGLVLAVVAAAFLLAEAIRTSPFGRVGWPRCGSC